jgi:hypothetical protein
METKISLPQELADRMIELNNEYHSLKIKISSKCIEREKIKKEISYMDSDIEGMIESAISIEEDLQRIFDRIMEEYGEGDLDIPNGAFYKSV